MEPKAWFLDILPGAMFFLTFDVAIIVFIIYVVRVIIKKLSNIEKLLEQLLKK